MGLCASGYAAGLSMPYCIHPTICVLFFLIHTDVAIGAAAGHLAWQIGTVDLQNGADCMRKFISNKWFGAIIFGGIVLGKFFHANSDEEQPENALIAPVQKQNIQN